jgi:hypothetical protein
MNEEYDEQRVREDKQKAEYERQREEYNKEIEMRRTYALAALPQGMTGMFEYAAEAMKALILISAGSAAALLALIGHLVTEGRGDMAKALSFPLCIFMASAIFAAGSFGLSYLSQLYINQAYVYLCLWKEKYSQEFQAVSKLNVLWQRLAIVLMLVAFAVCFYGVWEAYWAFMAF